MEACDDRHAARGHCPRAGATGKGILAADESHPHDREALRGDRGREHGGEPPASTGRCSSPRRGSAEFISGVILFDETIRQKAAGGKPFREVLASGGIIPGIKVDNGTKPLAGAASEQITEGLDGLRERLAEYRELGARFAKWRAVITIGPGVPRRRPASTPTPTRWPATRRSARRPGSSRSSSPRS